jgi:RimJ/RimL family protein N-acetyltransferase
MSQLPKKFTLSSLPLTLTFGRRSCVLRRLNSKDVRKLLEFYGTHSPETIQQRYGYAGFGLKPQKTEELLDGKNDRNEVFAVCEKEGKFNRIVAVGCYSVDETGNIAEPAFVVREDRRCLGMASTLLDVLMRSAKARGLACLRAQTHADNFAMLGIFLKMGGSIKAIEGTGAVEVLLPLS